jgi:hypothetical protein
MFQNYRQHNRRQPLKQIQIKWIGNNIESRQWTFRVNNPTNAELPNIIENLSHINRWAYIASVRNNHNNDTLATTGIIVFDEPRSLNWVRRYVTPNANWNALITTQQQWIQYFQQIMQIAHDNYYLIDIDDRIEFL